MALFTTSYYEGPLLPEEYKVKGFALAGEKLPPLAEEMLYSAARYVDNDIYWPKLLKTKCFWKCLKPELTANQQKLSFPDDFYGLLEQIKAYQAHEKEERLANSTPETVELKKQEKEALKKKYGYALIDGQKVELGGFMVEAPSLIVTRGDSPIFGLWKYRVREEDITLNINNCKAPKGWKGKVESNPNAMWIFKYKQEVGRPGIKEHYFAPKKVAFSATSSFKMESNANKFDKTAGVIDDWKKISKHISKGIQSPNEREKESALIAFIIQETGIRVGNERNLDLMADTVGASTLKKSNIKFLDS